MILLSKKSSHSIINRNGHKKTTMSSISIAVKVYSVWFKWGFGSKERSGFFSVGKVFSPSVKKPYKYADNSPHHRGILYSLMFLNTSIIIHMKNTDMIMMWNSFILSFLQWPNQLFHPCQHHLDSFFLIKYIPLQGLQCLIDCIHDFLL